jgi:uncharacterized membrane protein YfcA
MLKMVGLFFVTAILYAAVGFGGGSTYSALLVLANTDYLILPSIALICNIIVVSGGTLRFHNKQLIPWQKIWPLFALSVPMAWLGGRIIVAETVFLLLLGAALLVAGLSMLIQQKHSEVATASIRGRFFIPISGAALGLLSGLVGIGGGIFLAPILHLLRWQKAKVIAGVCSAFILVNSLAGLVGQMMKLEQAHYLGKLADYWPLFITVFIGGQIGSISASGWLNPRWVKFLTALLILFVAARLLIRSAGNI